MMPSSQIRDVQLATTSCTIPAGKQYSYPILVSVPNTVLSWSFYSSYYDIDFAVQRELEDENTEVIVEKETFSADTTYQGKILVNECGTYNLIWDNSRAWIRERNVVFSVSLKIPQLPTSMRNRCSSCAVTAFSYP